MTPGEKNRLDKGLEARDAGSDMSPRLPFASTFFSAPRASGVLRALAVLSLALFASGCQEMIDRLRGKEPPVCPKVAILSDASKLTLFREGPGRDITDIIYELEVAGYVGDCALKDKTSHVELVLRPMFDISRGPAAFDGKGEIRYFIAIADRAKEIFTAKFKFESDKPRIRHVDDDIILDIPIRSGDTPYNTTVYIGLQLTPDQLEYNRKTKR